MRRVKELLVLAVLTLSINNVFAQKDHLKFAGIAIDGTITQFQTKLIEKGYETYKNLNAQLPVGSRAFKGNFVNNKVIVFVYYDENSKYVYRVKVVIDKLGEDISKQKFQQFKELFNKKYQAYIVEQDNTFALLPIRNVDLPEDTDKWQNSYGEIDVYIRKDESMLNYPYLYNIHIDYVDQINSDKHENSVIEDL